MGGCPLASSLEPDQIELTALTKVYVPVWVRFRVDRSFFNCCRLCYQKQGPPPPAEQPPPVAAKPQTAPKPQVAPKPQKSQQDVVEPAAVPAAATASPAVRYVQRYVQFLLNRIKF